MPLTQSAAVRSSMADHQEGRLHHRFEAMIRRSPNMSILIDALDALEWQGDPKTLVDVLPHFTDRFDLVDLRNALARLGFVSQWQQSTMREIDPRLLPCIFLPEHDRWCVLTISASGEMEAIENGTPRPISEEELDTPGTAFFIATEDGTASEARSHFPWMTRVLARFRSSLLMLSVLTAFVSLISLVVPLFTMVIYDKVVGERSEGLIGPLFIAALLLLGFEFGMRLIRGAIVSDIAGRLDYLLSTSTFAKILSLPMSSIGRASVSTQIARLREFDSIRNLIMGPMTSVMLDIPFIILFLFAIGFVAGPVVIVNLVSVGVYVAFSVFWMPTLRESFSRAGRANSELNGFVLETAKSLRTLKSVCSEDVWYERARAHSARAASARASVAMRESITQSLTQLITALTVVGVVGIGTLRILDGHMSVGALIAVTALSWRILGPLNSAFGAITKFNTTKLSITQINSLMDLKEEQAEGAIFVRPTEIRGDIAFNRVSFRYTSRDEPALLGATFSVKAGEHVALVGPNGSGRTTLLQMVAGLHHPQAGSVMIDGSDIRQFGVRDLRNQVAYVAQHPSLFYGSIAQNLLLTNPLASMNEVEEVCRRCGLLDEINAQPDGFDTRVRDTEAGRLSQGMMQKLTIARALLRRPKVLLLDEPANSLDLGADQMLVKLLKEIRGDITVLMATHRPSHARICDSALVLNNGIIEYQGDPETALRLAGIASARIGGKR